MNDKKHKPEQEEEQHETKKEEKKELEEAVASYEEQIKRAVADYRNLEKRFEEEKRDIVRYANKELLERLIPAFDTLFLAGKYTEDEGVKITMKSVLSALHDLGVEKIQTDGVEFNPELMEGIELVEGADGMVIEEIRPGFTLYGKLLRPAHVKVGKE